MAQVLLNQCLPNWSEKNEQVLENMYPLHFACRNGNVTTLALLLESGRHSLTELDCFLGWTPLHWASLTGQVNCVIKLLSVFPTADVYGKDSMTPSHVAAGAGQTECLARLLQAKANPNLQDEMNETALHKAARTGSEQCIQILLLAGGSPRILNKSGETAAQIALSLGHLSVATFLNIAEVGVHVQNGLKENGFHANGTSQINGTHINGILMPHNRFLNRKRSLDDMFNGQAKKTRVEEESGAPIPPAAVQQTPVDSSMPSMGTSSVDHRLWCRAERGYDRMFLECMISQVHGS